MAQEGGSVWEMMGNNNNKNTVDGIGAKISVIAAAAFSVVSFVATAEGFRSLMPGWTAWLAAFALQTAMFSAGLRFSHSRNLFRRSLCLLTFLATASLSILFSYVGIHSRLAKEIRQTRNPVIELNDFQKARGDLQEQAMQLRAEALERLNESIVDAGAGAGVAKADQDTKRELAAQLRAQINDLTQRAQRSQGRLLWRIRRRLAALQRNLQLAEARANVTTLDAAKLQEQLGILKEQKIKVENYQPDFLRVKDKDWDSLRQKYGELSELWSALPDDFRSATSLPSPPESPVLRDGHFREGDDDPIVETISTVLHPMPFEVFEIALAAAFDLFPLLVMLVGRDAGRSTPDKLAALRRWMKSVKLELNSMDGVLRWAWRAFTSLLFTKASEINDPRLIAFRQLLDQLRREMKDFLCGSSLPDTLAEAIETQLTELYSRAVVTLFETSTRLESMALGAYQVCLDELESAGLDQRSREQIREFLNRQVERFGEAIRDYSSDPANPSATIN